jgi:hypothetical protein
VHKFVRINPLDGGIPQAFTILDSTIKKQMVNKSTPEWHPMGIKPYLPPLLQLDFLWMLSYILHGTKAYYNHAGNRINPSAGVWQTKPWILVGRHLPPTPTLAKSSRFEFEYGVHEGFLAPATFMIV